MQSFGVLFVISQTKLRNKQLSCRWFETPWCSCDVTELLSEKGAANLEYHDLNFLIAKEILKKENNSP